MIKDNAEKLRAGELYFDLAVLVASLIILILAYRISGLALSAAGTFPMASSAVMVASMLMILWNNQKKDRVNQDGFVSELRQTIQQVFTKDLMVFTCLTTFYIAAIEPLHFLPSSFVFIMLSIIYLKGSTLGRATLISAATLAFIYIVFLYFFKVLLP